MKDRQDMTEEEHRLQDARELAAKTYREAAFSEFGAQVERGERDDCQQMRIARAIVAPTLPHTDEFLTAWDRLTVGQ